MVVVVQVKTWVKERLEKLTPLSEQPENVRKDLEKLQEEVKHRQTLMFEVGKGLA